MTLLEFRALLAKLADQHSKCEQKEISEGILKFATLFEGPDKEKVTKTVKRIAAARASGTAP